MKLKICILSGILLCSVQMTAQNLNIDVLPPSITIRQDSAVVSIKLTVSAPDMDTKSSIRLTPILMTDKQQAELSQILLNGKNAHRLYKRNQMLSRRRGRQEKSQLFAAMAISNGDPITINYRASIPADSWMQYASLSLKKEIFNSNGDKTQSENIALGSKANAFHTVRPESGKSNAAASSALPVVPAETYPTLSQQQYFKGSYLSPESDATDERNQKELNFSLDEARVVAEINPQMLSLRELYIVALSYKNNPGQFYKIIDISVKIYPASPVANLNAAAASIERGNAQAAGRYLQMASHETIAYKNCRGAYELMCNNTYEGIRLLKAAQAEGSEEAAHNLKLFFESNQNALIQ